MGRWVSVSESAVQRQTDTIMIPESLTGLRGHYSMVLANKLIIGANLVSLPLSVKEMCCRDTGVQDLTDRLTAVAVGGAVINSPLGR